MSHDLIDALLGESDDLPEKDQAPRDLNQGERLDSHDAALYREAIDVLRAAADQGLYAPQERNAPARGRVVSLLVRISAVAAALTLIATAAFWATQDDLQRVRVYESSVVYGALLPEELGPNGDILPVAEGDGYHLRSGTVFVSAIGASKVHRISSGESLLEDSEIRCGTDRGARIDLPGGGQLFLPRLATIQLRRRADGHAALRLITGSAATVAGSEPLHLAVDGTDLLLTQYNGAAYLRTAQSDVTCLRGRLELHLASGERWTVPAGERLPAACARAPESEPLRIEDYELDWYDQLLGQRRRRETVEFDENGRSKEIVCKEQTQLYLAANAHEDTTLTVQFGSDKPRTFELRAGRTLELRIALGSRRTGAIKVSPRSVVRAARLFE